MDSPSVPSEVSSATDPSPSARALSTAKAGSHPTSPIAYWPQIWPRGLNDFISPPTPSSLCCQGSVTDHTISSQLSDGHLSPSELRKAYLKHKSTSDGIGITQNEPRIISAEYYELPDVDMIRFRTTEDTDILHGDLILQHQPERPGSFVKAATSNKRGNFRSLLGLSTASHGFHAVAVDKMDTHVISTFGIGYLPQRIGFISPLPFDSLVVLTQMISSRLSRSTIASQQPTLFAKIMWNCLQWLESQKRVSPPVSRTSSHLASGYPSVVFPPGLHQVHNEDQDTLGVPSIDHNYHLQENARAARLGMSHSQAHIPVDTASIIEATIEYVKDTFGRQLRDFHHEVFQCQMGCNGTATTSQMKQESMQEEINNLNRVVDAKMTSWNEMDEERDRLMEEMDRLMGELKAAGISHSQK